MPDLQGGMFGKGIKERGAILPFVKTEDGSTEWGWPQIALDAWNALKLPGDVYNGKVDPASQEGMNRAFDLAGMLTLGSAAMPKPANSLAMGIKAYHGSPHQFDRFDLSKIGTGEGAQAYGHGLYFAENPNVAAVYRNLADSPGPVPQNVSDILKTVDYLGFEGPGSAITNIRMHPSDWMQRWDVNPSRSAEEKVAADVINKYISDNPRGHMYEVNINANPEQFLDWDAPLSKQPKNVQEALGNLGIKHDPAEDRAFDDALLSALTGDANQVLPKQPRDPLGSELYRRSGSIFESSSDPVRSQAFREAGIPGIRYLDQGSRAAGDGSRNYVVFDDKLIDIIKRYGIAGLLASPVAAAYQGNEQ